jgi:TolB protein
VRGARRCYIESSTSWAGRVPYGVSVTDHETFEETGPLVPDPPSRARRAATIAILIALIVSMIFLAFVSGRGIVEPATPPKTLTPELAVIDGAGRLTTTDAVGGATVSYGGPDMTFSFPAWSPDGKRIAAFGWDATAGILAVFDVQPEGDPSADPVIVYRSADRPAFYLYWSPDGSSLAFLTTEPEGLALRIAPADGSGPVVAIHDGSPLYWAWTEPDSLLVHSGGNAPDAFIGLIGIDGASRERSSIEAGGFRAPSISPDGRLRGYVTPGADSPDAIVIEGLDGTNRQSVGVFGPAAIDFSPVADDLAFIAPDAPSPGAVLPVGPLRLLAGRTGLVRTVLSGSVIAFMWAPDGRTIAGLQLGSGPDDNVALDTSARLAALGRASIAPRRPAAAAPGLDVRLVFVDVASGAIRSHRQVTLSDLFVGQYLPFFDQYALSHRLWSADGASVILPLATADGATHLTIIPADGSAPRDLPTGDLGFWRP